ncbi:MAG: DNA repair protein RadA [Acidimicrobiia bacterium]|nr:DNA repair protein RadA [Acidimicrobiia bacterium]
MRYRCESCGYSSPKWMGFCPGCGDPAPLVEAPAAPGRPGASRAARVTPLTEVGPDSARRLLTGIEEIDRVLGGGLVPGATVLLGGEPGVGKSTLLLQVAGVLAAAGSTVLMASAEESAAQVALRAGRLGLAYPGVLLAAERDVDAIIAAADRARPDLLVVDSVQTVAAAEVGGTPGGVAQVREAAARLVHFSKESGVPVVLVGHVTKDGSIAGPRLLEHAVDVVLYLEGDVERGLRVLRSLKNRFGATHQVGLFEMGDAGMRPVPDPSGWLVAGWKGDVPGSVVFPSVDGRRPLLVEVQALVSPHAVATPRRSVRGLEAARVHQVLAVLDRHARFRLGDRDVYVSVVGGLQVRDPGADLPVAIALVSSYLDRPLGPIAAWGEVGLTGEVRAVAYGDRRAGEAARLGVGVVVGPTGNGEDRIERALVRAGLPPAS